ncbi:MAG: glycoside hydrolase family 3 N-terminal domain-containing protein, partial [Thermodesulfobacteriota bacterium]
ISELPLLFGIDAERGLGQMLSGATYFPFLMSQGAINDPEMIKKQAEITAEEMLYAGLNLIFAPVLDVNTNPKNPIINVRSFGDNPLMVSKLGLQFINEIQKHGILSCCKHFPGHGSTSEDSHAFLPVVEDSYEELLSEDLIPFISAIEGKVASIMPAHISFPNIDKSGQPATLSKIMLQDVLRQRLGFNGLIISDSFKMGALNQFGDDSQNAFKALTAGVDIILDPQDLFDLIKYLSTKINSIEKRINNSLNRIFYYKKFIYPGAYDGVAPDFENNKKFSEIISKKSVCMLKGRPLINSNAMVYIFDSDKKKPHNFDLFLDCIEAEKINVVRKFYHPHIVDIPFDTSLIFILSTTVSAWTKQFDVPKEAEDFIKSFKDCKNEKALLLFGSPYPAERFIFFDTIILSFDSTSDCQRSALDVLTGKLKPEGKLSIDL